MASLELTFSLIGAYVLLPYNCLLTSMPYWDAVAFDGKGFVFTSMLVYSLPLCLAQAFLTFYGDRFTIAGRIRVSFVAGAVICIAFTVIAAIAQGDFDGNALYMLCLVWVAALAVMNALLQTALLGFAGAFAGPEAGAAVMFGFGVSGLVALAVSLVLKLFAQWLGLAAQTTILFGFSIAYTMLSYWLFGVLCRDEQGAIVLKGLEDRRQETLPHSSEARVLTTLVEEASESPSTAARSQLLRITAVLWEIRGQALNIFLVFVATMSVFPGVLQHWRVAGTSSRFAENPDLFVTLLIGVFQIFDTVGRKLVACFLPCIRPSLLWIGVFFRFAFVPLFMMGQRFPEGCELWGADWGRFLLVTALATSNGLFASLSMAFGTGGVAEEKKEVAAMGLSFVMVSGIFFGSMLALVTQA